MLIEFENSFTVGFYNKFAAWLLLYFTCIITATFQSFCLHADMFDFHQVNKWWFVGVSKLRKTNLILVDLGLRFIGHKSYIAILLWCAADKQQLPDVREISGEFFIFHTSHTTLFAIKGRNNKKTVTQCSWIPSLRQPSGIHWIHLVSFHQSCGCRHPYQSQVNYRIWG